MESVNAQVYLWTASTYALVGYLMRRRARRTNLSAQSPD